jgi:hypothetical protein
MPAPALNDNRRGLALQSSEEAGLGTGGGGGLGGSFFDHLTEDHTEVHTVYGWVKEWGFEIDGVVVVSAVPPNAEHAGTPKVPDNAPNSAASEGHPVHDFFDGAIRVRRYEEEDRAVAGYQIPMVARLHH